MAIPATTASIWVAKSTHEVDQCAAAQTARAGASMKDTSTAAASSEMAVRRSVSGTAAMTACRVIEKVGMTNRPATSASTRSSSYPTKGAMLQQTTATPIDGTSTRRRPRRSSRRPRHGPLTAMATVATAVRAPAAAYDRPRVLTTCRVSRMPLAKTGRRTSVPRTRAVRSGRLARARR